MELPEDRNILLKDILETDVDEKYYLNDSAIKTIHRNFGSKGKILDLTKEDSLLEKNYISKQNSTKRRIEMSYINIFYGNWRW